MTKRTRRFLVWGTAGVAVVALALLFGVPLVLRGPILARVVARQSAKLCGEVSVEGGHLALGIAPALLRQRPFDVALDGLRIRDPSGDPVLHARTVRLRVAVLRAPWRLVVHEARVADGGWKMASGGPGRPPGFTTALRPVPTEGGRAACAAPAPPKAKPAGPPRTLVEARAVTLDDITVELSFTAWGVAMTSLDARGTAEVRTTPTGTRFLFDARALRTDQGGTLRVGRSSARRAPRLPFDQVRITRVAVIEEAPEDLLLVVERARTGRAVLSGEAVFTDVFAAKPRKVPVGMDLSARWSAVGDALARSPGWGTLGRRLSILGADLQTNLHGPFAEMTGTATIAGRGLSLRARLLPERRYAADLRFDRLQTGPLVGPAQRRLLGGRLTGQLSVRAQLARSPRDTTVTLEPVDLVLERHHGRPRRVVVSRCERSASTEEDLRLLLGRIQLRRGVVNVAPFRLRGPGFAIAGGGHTELIPGKRTPGRTVALITASLDLDRLLPRGAASGRIQLRLALDGTVRALRMTASTQGTPSVHLRGESLRLPDTFVVRFLERRLLVLDPLSIEHLRGGSIEARGWLRFGGTGGSAMRAHLATHAYRLGRMPALAWALAPARRDEIERRLRGKADVALTMAGPVRRPSLSGFIAVSDVRYRDQRLGDGGVAFSARPGGTRFEGRMVDGVNVRGSLTFFPRPVGWVRATLHEFPLGEMVPAKLAALDLRASGLIDLTLPGTGPPRTTTRIALRGSGVDVTTSMQLVGGDASGRLRGELVLDSIPVARFGLRNAEGRIELELGWRANLARRRPWLDGTVAIARPVSLWPASMPSAVVVAPVTLELAGDEVRTASLAVSTDGVTSSFAGAVRIDWTDVRESTIAGALEGRLDGGALAPWLRGKPTGAGAAELTAQLTGPLRAPSAHGQLRLQALALRWPASPVGGVVLDGTVDIADRTLLFRPLVARFESGGWLRLGALDSPSRIEILGASPFRLGEVALALRADGVALRHPISGLTFDELTLELRLGGPAEGPMLVAGAVELDHARYDLSARKRAARPASARPTTVAQPLRDRTWLEVAIRGTDSRVEVPYVPDVSFRFSCLIAGSARAPTVTGEVNGLGLYSRAILAIADWTSGRALRACDFGPR